jgi:hypothetical protein
MAGIFLDAFKLHWALCGNRRGVGLHSITRCPLDRETLSLVKEQWKHLATSNTALAVMRITHVSAISLCTFVGLRGLFLQFRGPWTGTGAGT